MGKISKISTPDWIKEGYNSKADWEKAKGIKIKKKPQGKIFKIKICPKCKSHKVKVILGGEEGKGVKGWQCFNCNWKGKDISENEVSEEEFLKQFDEMENIEEEK